MAIMRENRYTDCWGLALRENWISNNRTFAKSVRSARGAHPASSVVPERFEGWGLSIPKGQAGPRIQYGVKLLSEFRAIRIAPCVSPTEIHKLALCPGTHTTLLCNDLFLLPNKHDTFCLPPRLPLPWFFWIFQHSLLLCPVFKKRGKFPLLICNGL